MEKAWIWCCCLLAMTILASECGAQDTSCITQLVPCLNYINSTTGRPSKDCCDPLMSVIKSNPQCLCSLISSNTASGGINETQALLLPSKCGVNVNASICSASSKDLTPSVSLLLQWKCFPLPMLLNLRKFTVLDWVEKKFPNPNSLNECNKYRQFISKVWSWMGSVKVFLNGESCLYN